MDYNDDYWMSLAINEAVKGMGSANPNPCVGSVIVKDNKLISKGYHKQYGQEHAEVNAIKNAKVDLTGSILYVTLEPCSNFGKTGPCTEIILKNKFSKVVIGSLDPNIVNKNKAVEILSSEGIEVKTGCLKNECDNIIKVFNKFINTNIPYVTCKWAMTLDGKIATRDFKSKWITNEESRKIVKIERSKHMAIMVGANTIVKDDPTLLSLDKLHNPIRIIVDPELIVDPRSLIFKTSDKSDIIIITDNKNIEKSKLFNSAKFIFISSVENKFDLKEMLLAIGRESIDSIFLEGGAELNGSMFDSKLVDSVQTYIGNKIFSDKFGLNPINGKGINDVSSSMYLNNIVVDKIKDDIVIKGDVVYV